MKFALAYYGKPEFRSEEECKEYMSEWKAWVKKLGDKMVDPGFPLKSPKTVSSEGVSDGNSPDRLSGYSIVETESIEEAIGMVKGCPHLKFGTIDVAEVMEEMKMN